MLEFSPDVPVNGGPVRPGWRSITSGVGTVHPFLGKIKGRESPMLWLVRSVQPVVRVGGYFARTEGWEGGPVLRRLVLDPRQKGGKDRRVWCRGLPLVTFKVRTERRNDPRVHSEVGLPLRKCPDTRLFVRLKGCVYYNPAPWKG